MSIQISIVLASLSLLSGVGRCGVAMDQRPTHEPFISMGESVTPHAEISRPREWTLLCCGVDTLDLSLSVDWPETWPELRHRLELAKSSAQCRNKPIPFHDSPSEVCRVYPTGKPPNYRYHLETPECHLFVGDSQFSDRWSNVYASIRARTLWSKGLERSVASVVALIGSLDPEARVCKVKPSRCDLCADFQIPDGLPFELFRDCGVPKRLKTNPHFSGEVLETYYIGSRKASMRARVYDKSKEVVAHRKFWLADLWGEENLSGVWRVEFQFRRTLLHQFGIDSVEDLRLKLGGLWKHLTHKFYSLRVLDNPNVSRRSVHPWWRAVQDCVSRFGPSVELDRKLESDSKAGSEFYLARGSSALVGFAAAFGYHDLGCAVDEFAGAVKRRWTQEEFEEARMMKSIEMGKVFERVGGSHG